MTILKEKKRKGKAGLDSENGNRNMVSHKVRDSSLMV
jgi:hypothetical protein